MPSAPTLAAFAGASLMLILLPGPAMLFLVARGVAGGRRVGVMSALGVDSATATFVVATALGLTAVLATSALALSVVRFVGAGYLVWLGIGVLRRRNGDVAPAAALPSASAPTRQSDWTSWRQGYVVGIANPKVALFFLAFFPQFLDPARGSMTVQILVLGAVFVGIGTFFDTSYGALAGTLSARMARRRAERTGSARRSARGRIAIGLTYIGLGGFTAATGTRAL
ncbi:LysE family translocator [Knoellia sp. LjRoot47]|uniref:LysE family translocator n=1 Tax=Knoellia sp. LjRoot47 TaxID=3342330 RepID=UPI003ECE7B3D